MTVPIDARPAMRKGWTATGKTAHLRRPDTLPIDRTYHSPRYLTLCGVRAFAYSRGVHGERCEKCWRIAGDEAPE